MFEGYEVPRKLRETVIAIMRRFSIFGICDGMYIANVIAYHNGMGNGSGQFNGSNNTISEDTADYLIRAYGCNIEKADRDELIGILKTGQMDNKRVIQGMTKFISKRLHQTA